jgi:dipeptidyl aminopeptidase/acylaminoacyl peptidase
MLRSAALLAVVLVAAGCGSSKAVEQGPASGPVKRYLVYEKLVGKKGVWIADADGSDPRLLVASGHSPVISPDGSSVAYVGGCNGEDVCDGTYIISTAGGKPRRVSSETPVRWAPDSKRLVVRTKVALLAIDASTGKKTTLVKGDVRGWSFSPDGSQIVFGRAQEGEDSGTDEVNLFVADSAGGEPKQITEGGDSESPVWGPKSIAFSKIVWSDDGWGRNEIWRIQPDGSGRETITGSLLEMLRGTSGYDGLAPVAWSDDGSALLGGMLNAAGAAPFATDPDSGKARALATEEEFVDAAAISHDGQSVLAYTHPPIGGTGGENTAVFIVPYDGGKPTVVARRAGSPSWNR